MRRGLLVLAFALAACVDSGQAVPWPESFQLGYFIGGADGSTPQISAGFDSTVDVLPWAQARGAPAYLVTIDPVALPTIDPRLDPSVPVQLEWTSEALDADPRCIERGYAHLRSDGPRVERPLSTVPGARVYRLDPDGPAFVEDASGQLPQALQTSIVYGLKPCLEGRALEWEVFYADPSASREDQFSRLVYVDDDLVVAAGRTGDVRMLWRGGRRLDWIPAADFPHPPELVSSRVFALDLDTSDWPRRPARALVSYGLYPNGGRRALQTVLVQAEVTPSGLTPVRELYRGDVDGTEAELGLIVDARFNGNGYVAVGSGLLLSATTMTATPTVEHEPSFAPKVITRTEDPLRPFAVGGEGMRVWRGDLSQGFRALIVEHLDATNAEIGSLAAATSTGGARLLIAGSSDGRLFRYERSWAAVPVHPEPPGDACALDSLCGRPQFISTNSKFNVEALAVIVENGQEVVFHQQFACSVVYASARGESCTIGDPIASHPINHPDDGYGARVMARRGNRVLVGESTIELREYRLGAR